MFLKPPQPNILTQNSEVFNLVTNKNNYCIKSSGF